MYCNVQLHTNVGWFLVSSSHKSLVPLNLSHMSPLAYKSFAIENNIVYHQMHINATDLTVRDTVDFQGKQPKLFKPFSPVSAKVMSSKLKMFLSTTKSVILFLGW